MELFISLLFAFSMLLVENVKVKIKLQKIKTVKTFERKTEDPILLIDFSY